MAALSIWSKEDGVLAAVAPLGLAAAAGTALVVDLDVDGPAYPGVTSLAEIAATGPTGRQLRPQRRGVCVLANGGIDAAAAAEILDAFVAGWPRVVFRARPAGTPPASSIRLYPLVPGAMFPIPARPRTVVQMSGWRLPPPHGSVVLPRPRIGTLRALLTGRLPGLGDPWIRAWRPVWEST